MVNGLPVREQDVASAGCGADVFVVRPVPSSGSLLELPDLPVHVLHALPAAWSGAGQGGGILLPVDFDRTTTKERLYPDLPICDAAQTAPMPAPRSGWTVCEYAAR